VELYLHSPNTPSWRGTQLGGAQGQLYLYLCILHLTKFNASCKGLNSTVIVYIVNEVH